MLISIIIPFYNSRDYIEACVLSCLDQSYRDFELIMVDDGSDDGSFDIVDKIAKKDSRIRLVSQENKGASAARNKGLDISRGDFIMFVDSDDTIDEGMLSSMLEVLSNHDEVDVIQTKVPKDFRNQDSDRIYSGGESVRCLLEGSWWGPVCKLIRRSSIGGLRFPKRTISEDYLFNYRLFSSISELYYSNQLFYHRRVRKDSLSRLAICERKFDELYNVEEVFNDVRSSYPEYKRLAEVHLAGTSLKLLFSSFSSGKRELYDNHLMHIYDLIRGNYFSILRNPRIPFKERLLLSGCFSSTMSLLSYRFYNFIKKNIL